MRLLAPLLLSALALVFLAAPPALAQTGSIAGQVGDADTGEPLSGAAVQVVRGGADVAGALTDESGRFRVDVPAGTYAVVVSLIGHETAREDGVTVAAGSTATVTIVLFSRAVALNPIVVTASRQEEKALDAPASVSVVTQEDVQEQAAPSIVEHVKGQPGVDVSQTGLQQANIVMRGFNNVFSGSLLVLTDYRYARVPSLRLNAYSFVPQNNLDIQRMEIVLGPGAALYGPNSANGVLHLLTTSPIDRQGTQIALAGGERSVFHGEVRHASRIGETAGIKISAQYFTGEDWKYTDPAEVAARNAALPGDPDTKIGLRNFDAERWSADARLDFRPWDDGDIVFAAGIANAISTIELTGIGAGQVDDWRYTYLQGRARKGRLFAQTFFNLSNAGDTYLLRTGQPIVDESYVLAGQIQHGRAVGDRLDFIYGIDAERTQPRTDETVNGRNEEDDTIDEIGGYLHGEARITEKLDFVGAIRLDHNSRLEDPVFSPRAALVLTPVPDQNFRLTFNRAFSTPSALNLFLDIVAARVPLTPTVGFNIRTLGTPESGFTYGRECPGGFDGGLCMRSPFVPGQRLPANAALAYNLLLQALAPAAVQPLLPALLDANPQVQTVLRRFDPASRSFVLDTEGPTDIERLKPTITNTIEAGYKGVLGGRFLLAADVYHSQIEDFITPLQVETSTVFLDPASTAAFLTAKLTPLVQAGQLPQAQAAAIIQQLTTGLAQVPIGQIVPDQVDDSDVILAYRNFGDLDLWGADFAAELLVADHWSLNGSYSWVSEECFDADDNGSCEDLLDIALNASQNKGSLGIRFDDQERGFGADARARFVSEFDMNSGVFIGTVESYTVVDANARYRLPFAPQAAISLTAMNLFDEEHSEFVGAPEMGRLVMLKLQYNLE